jgi:hypothetical protein
MMAAPKAMPMSRKVTKVTCHSPPHRTVIFEGTQG